MEQQRVLHPSYQWLRPVLPPAASRSSKDARGMVCGTREASTSPAQGFISFQVEVRNRNTPVDAAGTRGCCPGGGGGRTLTCSTVRT